MAIAQIDIDAFLELSGNNPVFDVRSPGEFNHAHIPGSCNLPLFSDEERKVVGTAYKQESRRKAIRIGLDFFGTKMRSMVEEVEKAGADTVLVHCWRGGMRSTAIAWLLDLYGFKVFTLAGGYKKFRQYVLETFNYPFRFHLIGGYTGSGKTGILHEMNRRGEPVIDLEALACHKGSAFGGIGQPVQPSQEMFENRLALELRPHSSAADYVWLEDESRRIGTLNLPPKIWSRMQRSNVWFLNVPFEARLDYISIDYGNLDKGQLGDAILRIQKRLGRQEAKLAINCLNENKTKECFRILLGYYDKYYGKSLSTRENANEHMIQVAAERVDGKENARLIIDTASARNREAGNKSATHVHQPS